MSGQGGAGHKRRCERPREMRVILNWGLKASALWFLKNAVSILWEENCKKDEVLGIQGEIQWILEQHGFELCETTYYMNYFQ